MAKIEETRRNKLRKQRICRPVSLERKKSVSELLDPANDVWVHLALIASKNSVLRGVKCG